MITQTIQSKAAGLLRSILRKVEPAPQEEPNTPAEPAAPAEPTTPATPAA